MCLYTYIWITCDRTLHSALLSGGITLVSAIVGLYIVTYQLRRQGENTAASNLQSEKLKLKKDIYSTVIETCDEVSDSLHSLHLYTLEGVSELQEHRAAGEDKNYGRPQFSVDELIKRYNKFSKANLKLIALVEKWRIVEPRIPIFRKAFTIQSEFLGGAFAELLTGAYRYFRINEAGTWSFRDSYVDAYQESRKKLFDEILGTKAFINDFQVAMQNALLGELFGRSLGMRKPSNPKLVVVDLNKVSEVETKLEELRRRGRTFDTAAGLNSLSAMR